SKPAKAPGVSVTRYPGRLARSGTCRKRRAEGGVDAALDLVCARGGRRRSVFRRAVAGESEGAPGREHWQVVAFTLAQKAPTLEVGPRGTLGRLAVRAGVGNTTGDADFDRRYAVRSEDDGFTATVLNKEVRAYLLST